MCGLVPFSFTYWIVSADYFFSAGIITYLKCSGQCHLQSIIGQFLLWVVYFFIWIFNKFRQSPHHLISNETLLFTRAFLQMAATSKLLGWDCFCLFAQSHSFWCLEDSLLLTQCPVYAMIGWVLKPARGKKRSTTSRLSPSWTRFFYWYIWILWHFLKHTIEYTAFNHLESTTHQASSFQSGIGIT